MGRAARHCFSRSARHAVRPPGGRAPRKGWHAGSGCLPACQRLFGARDVASRHAQLSVMAAQHPGLQTACTPRRRLAAACALSSINRSAGPGPGSRRRTLCCRRLGGGQLAADQRAGGPRLRPGRPRRRPRARCQRRGDRHACGGRARRAAAADVRAAERERVRAKRGADAVGARSGRGRVQPARLAARGGRARAGQPGGRQQVGRHRRALSLNQAHSTDLCRRTPSSAPALSLFHKCDANFAFDLFFPINRTLCQLNVRACLSLDADSG
jgi:hypothetical protein